MKNKIVCCMLASVMALSLASGCGSAKTDGQDTMETIVQESTEEESETIFGRITKIGEDTLTISVMSQMTAPTGEAPSGEVPTGKAPTGEAPTGEKPSGEAPSGDMPQMPNGEAPTGETTSGEERILTLTDQTVYQVNDTTATLSDLQVGDMVKVVVKGQEAESITVQSGMGGKMEDGMTPGANADTSVQTEGAYQVTDAQSFVGESYDTQDEDMSVIMVADGGTLELDNATVTKSGDVSNVENSEFYGQNAAVLVKSGSSASITDTQISTEAEGANAVFATGENAQITISGVTIQTKGNSSRGLDATYGGSITADTISIKTEGAHCAALATDRGEGTINVTNGTLNTSGEGSPCIYSTGEITVADSEGLSSGSGIAVVEGKNSITVTNSKLTAYGIGRANGGVDDAGVMIYQSMSGDAGEGTGFFTAVDSVLSISEESGKYATAPMFFVTNTDAVISLFGTELHFGSGILLSALGNDGEWGTEGANGGNVTFTAENQSLSGNALADAISTITMQLTDSEWSGTANGDDAAGSFRLSLDAESIWEVTGDSYLTVLENADASCSNIHSNGYNVYYDADAEGNAWLNGETITLPGGGSLMPQ